eukprot:4150338-Alexandrium_andersonii.AAC.1
MCIRDSLSDPNDELLARYLQAATLNQPQPPQPPLAPVAPGSEIVDLDTPPPRARPYDSPLARASPERAAAPSGAAAGGAAAG